MAATAGSATRPGPSLSVVGRPSPSHASVGDDPLLAGLTDEQEACVRATGAPVVVLAGAGTGKTTVLLRRLAWQSATGLVDPERTMVVTFTRATARELRLRLRRLGLARPPATSTLHALGLAVLRRAAEGSGRPGPVVTTRPLHLVREAAELVGTARRATLRQLADELAWLAAVEPADAEAAARLAERTGRVLSLASEDLFALARRYAGVKRRRGVVDQADLVTLAAEALRDPALAASVRHDCTHLLVDEAQDLTPAQWHLIDLLAPDPAGLTLVGDPEQAIYAFAGADPAALGRRAQSPGAVVCRLTRTFRSTPQIVRVANGLRRDPSGLLRSQRPDGPEPVVRRFDDVAAEAAAVAAELRATHAGGHGWRSMAVLARTNAQLDPVIEALRRRGIPLGGQARPEADWRRAVARALPEGPLRYLEPDLEGLVARALGSDSTAKEYPRGAGPAGAGRDSSRRVREMVTLVRDLVDLDRNADRESLLDLLAAEDEGDLALSPLVARHQPREAGGPGAARGLSEPTRPAARASSGSQAASPSAPGGVTVTTFHGAKGLEWDHVWLIGLDDSHFSVRDLRDDESTVAAEERRLTYVAVTRARWQLRLSWSSCDPAGRRRRPAPWLGQACLETPTRPTPLPEAAARVAALRRTLLS